MRKQTELSGFVVRGKFGRVFSRVSVVRALYSPALPGIPSRYGKK